MVRSARLRGLQVLSLSICLTGAAWSQQPPTSGSTLKTVETPPAPPPRTEGDAPLIVKPSAAPFREREESRIKVHVTGFRFTGNTQYSSERLAALLQDQIGKDLTIDGLNDAADVVKSFYRKAGYFLAIAYIPEQTAAGGVVEIAVLEGRVGKVPPASIQDGLSINRTLIDGIIAAAIQPGDLITERRVERALLLVRDLPGISAKAEMTTGAQIGEADIRFVVSRGDNLFTGSVDVDDFGNRYSGEFRGGLSLFANNPFGIGDLLTFRGQLTENKQTDYLRLGYVVPASFYGTKAGVNVANLRYGIGKDFEALGATGTAKVANVFVLQPIIRTSSGSVYAQATYEFKELRDETETPQSREKRRVNEIRLQTNGDSFDTLLGGGLNAFSLAATFGKLRFGSPGLADVDAATYRTGGNFTKINFSAQRLQALYSTEYANGDVSGKNLFSLLLQVNGQWSNKNLTAAEQFSVGGPDGVRAYPVGELNSDRAEVLTAELRYSSPALRMGPANTTLLLFYDYGHAEQFARPGSLSQAIVAASTVNGRFNRRSIAGHGIGLNVGAERSFELRLSLAWRDREAPISDTKDRRPRIYAQFIKSF